MSKTASIVVYTVIFALVLLLCVGACLPDGLQGSGSYLIYHAPINYIQGDKLFGKVQQTAYKVNLDEDADINQVASTLRSRLANMYGYWFCNVTVEGENKIIVNVPVTADENNTSASTVLSNITQTGAIEVVTSSTYDADDVILTAEHIKSTSTSRYSSSSSSYYIVNLNLTSEGSKIAASNLSEASSSSWSAYLAIDGTVTYGIAYTSGKLQVYTSGEAYCTALRGLIKSGTLNATLVEVPVGDETEPIITSTPIRIAYGILMLVVILACWIFMLVRYGKISLAVILSQLIAVLVFVLFAGGVYFNLLNVASAIGILGGYALMQVFCCMFLEKFRNYSAKTFASARHNAFAENNKLNIIVHAAVLVAGVILWLIPTGVTAPLGNALVYSAVLSFAVTMGLNRLFTALVEPIC